MRRFVGCLGVLMLLAGCAGIGTPTPTRPTATSAAAQVPPATPTSAATAMPTIAPTPTAVPMVVVVIDNPVNVRDSASADAASFATLDVGTELSVLGPDTTGPDGTTRWVHVAANGRDGYVRSDLVSAPRVYVAATATAVATSPPLPPTVVLTAAQSTGTTQAGIYAKYPIIDAADLSKRPDFYKGRTFRITGRIANVSEKNGITAFTMFAETPTGGAVPIAVGFQGSDTHIQEDVRLSAYCTGIGTISGTNGFGAKITEAACTADIISPP